MKSIISKMICAAVFLLLTSSAFAQKVHLSWTQSPDPSCGPVTGYNVYRADASGTENFASPLATVPGTVSVFDDATVVFNHTYFYKVKAFDGVACGNGISNASNEATAVIPQQIIIVQPQAPVLNAPSVIIP